MSPTDPNTPQPTTTPELTPAVPAMPDTQAVAPAPGAAVVTPDAPQAVAMTPPGAGKSNSKKMIMISGAVLLVLMLVIGGVVFFLTVSPSKQAVSATPAGEVAQESPAKLLEDVESLDLGEVDGEFKDIDSDLNTL